MNVNSQDRRIQALVRRFHETPTPEVAYELVVAQLRCEGSKELTWTGVLNHADAEIAALGERVRRAVRGAVRTYLANTAWAEGAAYLDIPMAKLAEISRAHYRFLDGVGPVTLGYLEQLFERLGLAWDEGSNLEAEQDYSCQGLGLVPPRYMGEFFDLLEAYRARVLMLERLVEVSPAYEALSKLKTLGSEVEDFDPWPTLEDEEWEERCKLLPKLIQQDLIYLFEGAGE